MRWILCFFFTFALSSRCQAEVLSPAQEGAAQTVFQNVLSPYCPGRTLQDCPSSDASLLKDKIRAHIASGQGAQAVTESLIKELGEEFRAAPLAQGFGAMAWIMPVVFFGIGITLLVRWILKGQK